ncbi:hypothetical protein L210DRAFT_1057496, partial [Boletus edulis BED1]
MSRETRSLFGVCILTTWHDNTCNPANGFTQAMELMFIGNALYIFIIANSNVTGVPDANFVLDQVTVDRYTHTPSSSTDYQYNVPVYVNESMTRRVQ